MARSQITFGKKEREKKKQQQRKEKEEKREERKATNKKGRPFEEMIAYMDEFGRITSTPPDPSKRKSIKLEDIQIAVPRRVAEDPASRIKNGVVTFFNETKGYGFIKDTDTQESVFVHFSALTEEVKENNKVTFEVEMGPKGPAASNVKVVR